MSAAIELAGISAGFGGEPFLRDVSLRIEAGEMAALLGPNGAGKSTLLRILTGRLPVTAGAVRLFGRDVARMGAAERAALVAVAPQDLAVAMPFTVEEVVGIGRTARLPRWRAPGAEHRRAIEEAMAWMDVLDLRARAFEELSGGERQRAVIAMALAQEPRLLLLDEPTSHLDIHHRIEILRLIERMNAERGLTVLLTSHDLNLAAEFCRRLLLLDHGRLVAEGSPAETLREPLLREVYHCDLRVRREADGALSVRPSRAPAPLAAGAGRQVHVVAGGGSGAEVFRRLSLQGHRITCGVLNEGDTDAQAAAALGFTAALERPFSPIGAAALDRARALASGADALVLCDVPFGPGNLANLELAESALARGIAVYVSDARLAERDFTADGAARRRIEALLRTGAHPWRSVDEVIAGLSDRGA